MERLIAAIEDVVFIIEDQGDGARLTEIWSDGFRSDTWHASINGARKKAEDWWEVTLYWDQIPSDVTNINVHAQKMFSAEKV